MSGEGAGYWIIISTIITVVAPIFARFMEQLLQRFLTKPNLFFSLQRRWKSSVQLVTNTTTNNFNTRTRMNTAYKAVIFHLMSKSTETGIGVPLSHIRQQMLDPRDEDDESEDVMNLNYNFIATDTKPVLLDETTETYVIATHEESTYRESVTTNEIINIVSNRATTTEILNLISGLQVKYQDYIKRYNKEGKIRYIKLRISKDLHLQPVPEGKGPGSTNHQVKSKEETVKRSLAWEISDFMSSKTFSNVFFTDKDRILQQIENFITGEEFYRHRGIPWTLNILLHGVPGCGKTSFIKALANKLKRHIVDVSLSAIKTTEEFRSVFNTEMFKDNYIPVDKRIIVLEDMDCMGSDILADRSAKEAEPATGGEDKMNLSCFLNTLDGIHEQNGRIIIATTNCIDGLDPAVLRRFNVKVHFTHLTRALTESIINNYYDYEVPLSDAWVPHNLTGATLTQLCMQFQEEPDMLVKTLYTI